jgi:hypothetical protein
MAIHMINILNRLTAEHYYLIMFLINGLYIVIFHLLSLQGKNKLKYYVALIHSNNL